MITSLPILATAYPALSTHLHTAGVRSKAWYEADAIRVGEIRPWMKGQGGGVTLGRVTRRSSVLLLLLTLMGCGRESPDQGRAGVHVESQELRAALDRSEHYAQEGMERWGVPGLALGIVKDGELVYARGFGFRDPSLKEKVTPTTTFGLASVTKAFTALTLGLMVQDGRVGWDTLVKEVVGEFSLSDPDLTSRVTFRDLLSHRTGLAEKESLWTSGEYRAEEIFLHLDEMEVVGPLRQHFEYSNVLYIAAAVMVEKLCGESWDVVARSRLLAPLGMRHTGFSVEEFLEEPEFSVSFSVEDGAYVANEFPGPEHNAWYFPRGSGSVYSDVEDMAKWLIFHLQEGRYGDGQVVDSSIVAETHRAAIRLTEPPFYMDYPGIQDQAYGMGWFIDDYRGHRRVHHGGVSMGYSNYVTLFPDDGIGIVVLSNRAVMFPVELMYYVGDVLLGLEPEDWGQRFAEYNASPS